MKEPHVLTAQLGLEVSTAHTSWSLLSWEISFPCSISFAPPFPGLYNRYANTSQVSPGMKEVTCGKVPIDLDLTIPDHSTK